MTPEQFCALINRLTYKPTLTISACVEDWLPSSVLVQLTIT